MLTKKWLGHNEVFCDPEVQDHELHNFERQTGLWQICHNFAKKMRVRHILVAIQTTLRQLNHKNAKSGFF